jgi:hypothetical protein
MQEERKDVEWKVFISHQWMDKQRVDRLARDLAPFADVWMDFRNLRPGDRFQQRINEALREMDMVLVVWTEHAARSKGVQAEIDTALELGLRIVPCIFKLDSNAWPDPPLLEPLQEILWVDFHDYGTGLALLTESIVQAKAERLPAGASMEGSPTLRLLNDIRGDLHYLTTYRDVRGVRDDRGVWADNIVSKIERYVESGGNKDTVRTLLEVARQSEVHDPEATGMMVERLKRLLGETPTAGAAPSPAPRPAGRRTAAPPWTPPPAPPPDELARRIRAVVPPGSADLWLTHVHRYIESAPTALQALTLYARGTGSQAGIQVVAYLQDYLDTADDLIPDHKGKYGLLDDAWLIVNTAFRLVESGLLPAVAVPVDWQTILAADAVVRAVVPPDALVSLEGMVLQILQLVASEITHYQPWFTPQGHGYAPTIAASRATGGAWEDQMSERLLGTGLSLYG